MAVVAAYGWPIFRLMGDNYESVVISSAFIGFMLELTANAMAVMQALWSRNFGPVATYARHTRVLKVVKEVICSRNLARPLAVPSATASVTLGKASSMRAFFSQYFGVVLVLVALALVLTAVVFRKRWFERGPQKGEAANPSKVKRENPPDELPRSR